jgi:hypothetical protein
MYFEIDSLAFLKRMQVRPGDCQAAFHSPPQSAACGDVEIPKWILSLSRVSNLNFICTQSISK